MRGLLCQPFLLGFFRLSCSFLFKFHKTLKDQCFINLVTVDRERDHGVRVGLHPRVYVRLGQNLLMGQVCRIAAIAGLTVLNGILDRVLVMVNLKLPALRVERQEKILLGAGLEGVIHGNIRMVHQFIHRWPLSVVVLQARIEEGEALKTEAHTLWEEVDATSDVLTQVGLASAREGSITREHLVKDAT